VSNLIKIYPKNPNQKEIDKITTVLKNGGLIIYPTDTVYGLGCDITNKKALEKVARIKGIKLEKSNFSFICNDLSNLSDYVKQFNTPVYKLLKRTLPGPYTYILKGNSALPKIFKRKKTVGIRVPDNNIIRAIVKSLGNPIVSTSIHDEDSILEYTTDPELIFEKWHNLVDIVVDGGYGGNIPSTVFDLTTQPDNIVREGNDLTVVTYGAMVHESNFAANKLADEGYSIEIVDIRTINPLDEETIYKSIKKTGKVAIVHEDTLTAGFGAEIAARISEKSFEYLDGPIKRIGALDAFIPFHHNLERAVLPTRDRIYTELKELLAY